MLWLSVSHSMERSITNRGQPVTRNSKRFVPLLAAMAALGGGGAQAALIQTTQIVASQSLGQYIYFSIDQVHDGNLGDAPPYNGYASGFGIVSGRITLTLDKAYDLDSFLLWNDVNVSDEGVRSFRLSFEDAVGNALGTTGVYSAVSQFAAQSYSFATVAGVKKVYLDVLNSNLQIEIRELAFNGTPAIPEPGTWAMLLSGLGAVGWMARRRR